MHRRLRQLPNCSARWRPAAASDVSAAVGSEPLGPPIHHRTDQVQSVSLSTFSPGRQDLLIIDIMGKNKNAGGGKGDKGGGKGGDEKDSGSGKQKLGIEIKVRHILCEKHSKKEEALAQLNAGVGWDEVAAKFSEHKAGDGGDLGWKEWGSLLFEFQNVAFELEPSSLKSPILGEAKTNQGYHIIMVQDRRKASKRK